MRILFENKKKNNKISSKIVLKTKKLSDVEKRYCSCLMKVRKTNFNPYGICTDSIYNKQGMTRNKIVECGKYYDFSKYTVPMLKYFLKEKKIKGISKMNKKEILKVLNKYQKSKPNIKKKQSKKNNIEKKQKIISFEEIVIA